MNLESILLWGFIATLVLTTIQEVSRGLRLTRMSLPVILGAWFTGDVDRVHRYGILAHVGAGWLISMIYALIFESVGAASWWLGTVIGLAHGVFTLTVLLPLMPSFHSRMAGEYQQLEPTAMLEPPGFMALNYGPRTPLIALVAHVLYGLTLGAFYEVVV